MKHRFIIAGLYVTVYLRSTCLMSHATIPLSDKLIHTEKLCDKSHHKSHEMEVTVPVSKRHVKKVGKKAENALYTFPFTMNVRDLFH